jgi:hypothetical protein
MAGKGPKIHTKKNTKNRTMRRVFMSPLELKTAQSGTKRGFSLKISVFFCQYYCINPPQT